MMAMSLLAGRYELRARIGVGGYGEVWRGIDSVLARPVAIKLLQAEHTVQPEAMMRFRAEARHAGALSHPCIAHVYDYCEPPAPDPPFLVMELVDGLSLAELLTRGPLEVARAMDVIGQAAAGLHAAHQAGLVHRDIKPGNLLISRSGPVKITDFGIAQAQVPASSGPVTMTGMVLGTAGYMAPERVEGNQATVASDLYALGVVAHECLAGLVPRGAAAARTDGATPSEPELAPLAPRTRPLPPLPATVPPDVAALVHRLTARDPARRPGNAGEVARQAAVLRDRYRDAPPRPDGAGGPAGEAGLDDTAWDNAVPAADPDRTALDSAARAEGAPTERGRAAEAAPTGPDPRPARRLAGQGWPSRTVLAIVMAAVTGLALLTFGVLEVLHQHDTPAALASPAHSTARTVDLRESALVGRRLAAVRRQLRADGLTVRVFWQDSDLPPGQVLRVAPSGRVRAGSVVTVVVAQAAVVTTTPTPPSRQLLPPGHGAQPTIKPVLSPSPSVSPSKSPSPPVSTTPTTSPPAGSSSPPPSSSPPTSPPVSPGD
jgi:eukaryotic-like serine/threonine-protein kinase